MRRIGRRSVRDLAQRLELKIIATATMIRDTESAVAHENAETIQ